MIEDTGCRGARITGAGYYVPDLVLTNFDFEKIVDTSDEWIVTRSGIRERHMASKDQASSDMAYEASCSALRDAGVQGSDLDLIVVGTVTPDMPFPSTACLLQDRLGAAGAAAFDVNAACSGFIYALTVAQSMVSAGKAQKALVLGVETLTRITDYTDRSTCVLFGDGSGAVVLEPCPRGEGIIGTFMRSDGSKPELLYLPAGGSRKPITAERINNRETFVRMKGDGLFKLAVRMMVEASEFVLNKANMKSSDLNYLIPHQANIRIIKGVKKRLHLSDEQVIVNIDRMGNTSSASIPIAFGEARRKGIFKKGDKILMVTFGGGLTWGAVLFEY